MEWTYVTFQGRNSGSPPRPLKAQALPLKQLWSQGIDPATRQQLLLILSRAAAKAALEGATLLAKPHQPMEASDE
jgi:hypothetical protein